MFILWAVASKLSWCSKEEIIMNELNSDWVLWASILSVVISLIAFLAFGWKMFKRLDNNSEK
jgi:heme/copper-type cytochrome/quinol oxidase subunit 2